MRRLSFLIVFVLCSFGLYGQSPHGSQLKIDCAQCHTSESWSVNSQFILFDHQVTQFPLEGVHKLTDCSSCHNTLVFENTQAECISCHKDIHEQSVGNDCTRCHTTDNWLVLNIPEIHESNGFSLVGNHANVSCSECHTNGNELNITPIGNECINCHEDTFNATTNPNHSSGGFSKECTQCHDASKLGWNFAGVDHSFFPLTQGHNIADCTQCHEMTNLSNISPDCVSCHQTNFDNTQQPKHSAAKFSTDCASCHTTAVGWKPANINHDFFPLTQGHNLADCTACHINYNYSNLSSNCVDCHQANYNATTNPNHSAANYPTNCATCHSTSPGWTPATVNHDFFPLTQGHNLTDCTACHINNNYSNLSSNCVDCHQANYNATTNPNHSAAKFPVDCASCHSTTPGWSPATFDHDSQYFPIYSGEHRGTWSSCTSCHKDPSNYASFSCFDCHSLSKMNSEHKNVNGYIYESNACFTCHPNPD